VIGYCDESRGYTDEKLNNELTGNKVHRQNDG